MIGDTIIKLRMKKGLSLTILAETAGVEVSYLSSVEKNNILFPSFEFMDKVSEVLGVTTDTFLLVAPETYDPVWNHIVDVALAANLTTETYVNFLQNIHHSKLNKLQHPISKIREERKIG